MFAEDEVTADDFLGGRITILQPRRGYRAAMDPVLLAAAVPAQDGESVLDLGCGVGTAALCLAARVPGLVLAGLERQASYAGLARRNAAANGIALDVIEGDVAAMPGVLRARSFDHVLLNPPYYPPGSGTAAEDAGREAAQREATPLAAWLDAATRRLRDGGVLTLIQMAERLPDVMVALAGRGSLTVLPVAPRMGRPAGRVVLSLRKGGRAPFRLLGPLILHAGAAHEGDRESHTPAARAILREGAPLPL